MSTVHVMPVADIIEHEFEDCACGPTTEFVPRDHDDQEDGWLVSHHSLDGRELKEPQP